MDEKKPARHYTERSPLFNESPEQQIYDDLHRMKQVIETGEVVRSDAVPEGMGPIMQEPAQPAKRETQAMEATR